MARNNCENLKQYYIVKLSQNNKGIVRLFPVVESLDLL